MHRKSTLVIPSSTPEDLLTGASPSHHTNRELDVSFPTRLCSPLARSSELCQADHISRSLQGRPQDLFADQQDRNMAGRIARQDVSSTPLPSSPFPRRSSFLKATAIEGTLRADSLPLSFFSGTSTLPSDHHDTMLSSSSVPFASRLSRFPSGPPLTLLLSPRQPQRRSGTSLRPRFQNRRPEQEGGLDPTRAAVSARGASPRPPLFRLSSCHLLPSRFSALTDHRFFLYACFAQTEAMFRDLSEVTNSRAVWWSALQILVIIATCYWQTKTLRVSPNDPSPYASSY